MESTFVRKDFYLTPPDKGATEADWKAWLKADTRKAAAHKAQVTKAQKHTEAPDEFQETSMRKIGGVWRQALSIGISGGGEEEGYTAEPMVEAQQEHHIALVGMEHNRHKRGGSRAGKSARRRKNRKLRCIKGGKE